LSRVRSEAGEGRGLSSVEEAEFRHEGEEVGGGLEADTGDGGEDVGVAFEGLGGLEDGGDPELDGLDLPVDAGEEVVEVRADGFGTGGLASVREGGALADEVVASEDEGLEGGAVRIGRLPASELGAAFPGIAGDSLGIEGVGFAQRAEGADEGLDLAGIGTVGGDVGGEESVEQGDFIAAGGFANDVCSRMERSRLSSWA